MTIAKNIEINTNNIHLENKLIQHKNGKIYPKSAVKPRPSGRGYKA